MRHRDAGGLRDRGEKHQKVARGDGSETPPNKAAGAPVAQAASKDKEAVWDALQWYWGRKMVSASLIKHEAFASEHEWRIVRLAFTDSGQVQFRTGKEEIIPYSAVSIADNEFPEHIAPRIIRRIVIGPPGNLPLSKLERDARSVKMLLEHYGAEVRSDRHRNGVIIERSALPC